MMFLVASTIIAMIGQEDDAASLAAPRRCVKATIFPGRTRFLRDMLHWPWLAAMYGLLVGPTAVSADELVQVAPQRAAAMQESSVDASPLLGYLARPDLAGRLPAVVVLHWCSGFGSHDTAAALKLKSWGYVALAPDSLGDANLCQHGSGSAAEAVDAYAALRWLVAQDFVDRSRVAVTGYSMGASAVLYATEAGPLERMQPEHFRAAVAYYPSCQISNGDMTVPMMILIGERDDWTTADACRKLAAHESDIGITRFPGQGVPVQLVVYPDAVHAFDSPGQPHTYLGHAIAHDAAAAGDAEARVRTFLRDTLGSAPAH
jgi:dienelactone hydrolase